MARIIKEDRVKDEKEGVIHVTRILREDLPTTRQWMEKFDEPIPKLTPRETKYKKITLDLSIERKDVEYPVSANNIMFLGSDGKFEIKFGSVKNDSLDETDFPVGNAIQIPIEKVYVTNIAQSGLSAKFLIW